MCCCGAAVQALRPALLTRNGAGAGRGVLPARQSRSISSHLHQLEQVGTPPRPVPERFHQHGGRPPTSMPPCVYHPDYSCAWPEKHRFPMWKFRDLHAVLTATATDADVGDSDGGLNASSEASLLHVSAADVLD
jgi:hypothetical protein